MNYRIKHLVEKRAFGVFTYLGERMNINTPVIRRYFIYVSFITMGSPLVFYLIAAFWINIRSYIKRTLNPLWD